MSATRFPMGRFTARVRLKRENIRVGFFIQIGYLGEQLDDILATRDLIDMALDHAAYLGAEDELSTSCLRWAWHNYFLSPGISHS